MINPLQIEYQAIYTEALPKYVLPTPINGLLVIERPSITDERGDFWEVARINDIEQATGKEFKIKQINRSRNISKGTLRGIHIANWNKLISVVRGSVFIALVDLRKNSPTFGKIYTDMIGDGYKTVSVLVPAGFGNSYQPLVDNTDFLYAVTDVWSPGSEVGLRWDDPTLNIQWPITPPILSEKDKVNPFLKDLFPDISL